MTTPALDVRHLRVELRRRAGAIRVLDDLSFDIAHGEILGVVGESGAGKSLTGAAVIGLLDAPATMSAGEVHIDGQRIDDLPPDARRRLRGRQVAAIFQDPLTALDPLYTIGEHLVETLRTHRALDRAAARECAIALLRETGLDAPELRMAQYPHELSGGMRQRVVIALALAGEPQVLVADEPTSALDVSVQAQVLALLRRVADVHGTALMLITHDLGVVAEICDRVAVMYAGRIVEMGPVPSVLQRPAHPYAAGLVASVPDLQDTRARLAQVDGVMPRPGELPDGCAFHPRCARASDRCRTERPELARCGRSLVACWWPLDEDRGA